jgi:hypothetical protein
MLLAPFVLVHRDICPGDEVVERRRVLRVEERGAYAQGQFISPCFRPVMAVENDIQPSYGGISTFMDCIYGKDREFIPAHAPDNVLFSEGVPENGGNLDKGFIAFLVIRCIIDLFHSVKVNKE